MLETIFLYISAFYFVSHIHINLKMNLTLRQKIYNAGKTDIYRRTTRLASLLILYKCFCCNSANTLTILAQENYNLNLSLKDIATLFL